jgi:hypothetical protein
MLKYNTMYVEYMTILWLLKHVGGAIMFQNWDFHVSLDPAHNKYKLLLLAYTSIHAPSMSNTQKIPCCDPNWASQTFKG